MPLTPNQSKTINDMSEILYNFLPGSRPPKSDQSLSFPGAAHDVGLHDYWWGGSKQPAIAGLLSRTYEHKRGKFCDLIIAIVNKGIIYRSSARSSKKSPITRQEIVALNELIAKLEFKIPQLWDSEFLRNLDGKTTPSGTTTNSSSIDYRALLSGFINLTKLDPQKRGYAFEIFLNNMFAEFGLNPRKSFRLIGEQIDGSFDLEGEHIILNEWDFAGFIDLDNAGVGDKHVDVFWATWSLFFNLHTHDYRDRFIDAYGRNKIDESILRIVGAVEVFG